MPGFRRAKLKDESPVYLTADGLRRLKEQLARTEAALPELISETARTGSFGDRSDNAEYKEAKGALRRAHGQIANIKDRLKRIVVIEEGASKDGVIKLGAKITLITESGDEKIYTLVGPYETNPAAGRISHESPLGAALLGHRAGNTITITTERGEKKFAIKEVA